MRGLHFWFFRDSSESDTWKRTSWQHVLRNGLKSIERAFEPRETSRSDLTHRGVDPSELRQLFERLQSVVGDGCLLQPQLVQVREVFQTRSETPQGGIVATRTGQVEHDPLFVLEDFPAERRGC